MRRENYVIYIAGAFALAIALLSMIAPAHARGGYASGSHYSRGEHVDGNNRRDYNTKGY